MSRSVLAALVFVLAVAAFGATGSARQNDDRIQRRTSAPADVRFEVIETSNGQTLRLDNTTGQVWYLRQGVGLMAPQTWIWRAIPQAEPDGPRPGSGPNYQIYTATGSPTMLVNLHSGMVWHLTRERTDWVWTPVVNER